MKLKNLNGAMKKPQPEIPDDLAGYARARSGGYEERYAAVLDEAFFVHRLFLNATNLKAIVGGGSLSTAHQAVEDFKSRLHARINYSIDLGGNVPQEIASKFANALDAFWGLTRQEANARWDADRLAIEQQLEAARDQARDVERRALAAAAELASLRTDLGQTVIDRDTLRATLVRAENDLSSLRQQVEASSRSELQLQAQVSQLQAQIGEQAQRAEQAHATQGEKFRAEQHEARKEHMLQLDASRTQARADAARAAESLERLREQVTTLTAAKSVAEAALAASQTEALGATAARAQLEAALRASEQIVATQLGQLATLGAQLEASAARSVDALGLLTWLHQIDPLKANAATIPWAEASTEARLGSAVLHALLAVSAKKNAEPSATE